MKIWPDLTTKKKIWPDLTIKKKIWPDLTIKKKIWHDLTIKKKIWPDLTTKRKFDLIYDHWKENSTWFLYFPCVHALTIPLLCLPVIRDAYSDRQLIPSFELKFFVWRHMFPYEDSKILSVCPNPKSWNHPGFVKISPTLVIDTSMERSSRVLQHGNPKVWISF